MLALSCRAIQPGSGHAEGRALLCAMYEAQFGAPMPPIAYLDRGKPYFPGSPIHFSITHTDHHVFCALSDRPIGIDAEELTRDISPRLAEKILSPAEYAQYEAAEDQRRALLTFWVLKEAQGKRSGQGISGYPNKTCFELHDPRVTVREGCLLAIIE